MNETAIAERDGRSRMLGVRFQGILTGRRKRRMDSRRDVLGCSRLEKNGSTTSKEKTATTELKTAFPGTDKETE